MAGQTSLSVAFAEHTTLPQLQLRDKKDVVQCSAFVNAFAVTREQGWYSRPNGSGRMRTMAYGLWYLSLLGEPGTGTTLQALYAGATENNVSHILHLKGIGEVVLGNQREDLLDQGYATHWHYTQQPVAIAPPSVPAEKQVPALAPSGGYVKPFRGVHGILEPRQMTIVDPQRADLTAPRRRAKKGKGARANKRQEEAVLSTGSADTADPETRHQAADLPCFLLLIPGHHQQDSSFRCALFLSFLSRRLPWPLKNEWAQPLWEACLGAGMIEQLLVWSYGMPLPGSSKPAVGLPEGCFPMISDGYLCTPQPAYLAQVVERLVAPATAGSPRRQSFSEQLRSAA